MLFVLLSENFLFFMYDFQPTNFDATRITLKFFAVFACFVVTGFWLRLRRARYFMVDIKIGTSLVQWTSCRRPVTMAFGGNHFPIFHLTGISVRNNGQTILIAVLNPN